MKRATSLFLRAVLVLALILGVVAVVSSFVPLSPLKRASEARLTEALGRQVRIQSARLNLLRGPSLTLNGMTADELPAFGGGHFLTVQEVQADLHLIRYLSSGRIEFGAIAFSSPQIRLVKTAEGTWSWTTLGSLQERSAGSAVARLLATAGLPASSAGKSRTPAFSRLVVSNASLKLIDLGGSQPPESLYKNVALSAEFEPSSNSQTGTRAKGELVIGSPDDGESEGLNVNLPFDLQIDGAGSPELTMSGSIGPGLMETKNVRVVSFALDGKIASKAGTPLTGEGRLSATEMMIPTINISERVASALRIDRIGDMNPGTSLTSLETDFLFSDSTVTTNGLRVQHLDGLGDATTHNGSFKIESALTVDYAATVILSSDSTLRVKSASTLLGLLATILETNQRLSVPILIRGDVRGPEIQVDVKRIF